MTATVLPEREGSVVIEDITGDGGRLPRNAARNCVGIAASKVLELIGRPTCGVSLRLQKVQMWEWAPLRNLRLQCCLTLEASCN